ncbi:DNA polymerase III subunit delta' [compost metagenome]
MLHALYHRHDQIVFIDELDFINRHASSRSQEQWIQAMALAAESRKKLRQNMNGQLCVEQFLIGVEGYH